MGTLTEDVIKSKQPVVAHEIKPPRQIRISEHRWMTNGGTYVNRRVPLLYYQRFFLSYRVDSIIASWRYASRLFDTWESGSFLHVVILPSRRHDICLRDIEDVVGGEGECCCQREERPRLLPLWERPRLLPLWKARMANIEEAAQEERPRLLPLWERPRPHPLCWLGCSITPSLLSTTYQKQIISKPHQHYSLPSDSGLSCTYKMQNADVDYCL